MSMSNMRFIGLRYQISSGAARFLFRDRRETIWGFFSQPEQAAVLTEGPPERYASGGFHESAAEYDYGSPPSMPLAPERKPYTLRGIPERSETVVPYMRRPFRWSAHAFLSDGDAQGPSFRSSFASVTKTRASGSVSFSWDDSV